MTLEELTTQLATSVVSQFGFIDVFNAGYRPVILFKIFRQDGSYVPWSIDLHSNIPRFRLGTMPDHAPDVTVEITERVMLDLATDKVLPLAVLGCGAIRITGDPKPLLLLARRLV